jgi:HK97 family phage prohead protease
MKKKFLTASFVEKDVTANTFTAVASTATVDRHGEIVSVDGWDLEKFKQNPVLLWSHDHTIPAIGKATKIWVEGFGDAAKLMFSGIWQTVTEEGKAAAQLVADGILNSFSVGFIPTEMVGNKYTEQELLEISLVNVPANPDAMMLAYKSLKDNGFNEDVAKKITQQFASMGAVRKDLFKAERGALQDELDEEAAWEAKYENMDKLYDIFWAFCDVYYNKDTPVEDFVPLVSEFITILQTIVDGTYVDPEDDTDDGDVIAEAVVIDKPKDNSKTVDKTAKAPEAAAPKVPSQKLRTQQSITKAIVQASDQILTGEKNGMPKDEMVKLVKIIKRGGEILSKSNKGDLNNG